MTKKKKRYQEIQQHASSHKEAKDPVLYDDPKKFDPKATTKQLLEDLRRLQEEHPQKFISRNFYRTHGGYSESTWTAKFGTFREYRRQAGLEPSRGQQEIERQIAKHASLDVYRGFYEVEVMPWVGKYQKDTKGRWKTLVVASDFHDKECDEFALDVFLDTCRRIQPDVVCLAGDILDAYEFSRFDKDPRQCDAAGRIKWAREHIFKALRNVCPKSQIDLVLGNHECVSLDTEILTEEGWVKAPELLNTQVKVASFDLETGAIRYEYPVAVANAGVKPLVRVYGDNADELVSADHHVVVDDERVRVSGLIGEKISADRMRFAGNAGYAGIPLTDDEIALLVWTVMDGTIVNSSPNKKRVQFKLSRERKLTALQALLTRMGFKFTFRKATMSGSNKLQPYYITLYGEEARWVFNQLEGVKRLPAQFIYCNSDQAKLVYETILETDGCAAYNHIAWTTTSEWDAEVVQRMCISNGIPCYYSLPRENASGFANGKPQYHVTIYHNGLSDRRKIQFESHGYGEVIAIQTVDSTLITRRNNKVSFTGNCRLLKVMAERTPYLREILSDFMGLSMADLFGIRDYEINMVSKWDLAAYKVSDLRAQVQKNYKTYWNSVTVCHYPDPGFRFGTNWVAGHTHRPELKTASKIGHLGPMPLWGFTNGCMAKIDTEYNGGIDTAQNSFLIVHVDTETLQAIPEPILFSDYGAIVGGQFYRRKGVK